MVDQQKCKFNSMYSVACYYVKLSQRIFENKYYVDALGLNVQINYSGLLFALDLFVPFVDLVISIRTNLLTLIRSDPQYTKQIRDTFYQIAPNLHSCYVCMH